MPSLIISLRLALPEKLATARRLAFQAAGSPLGACQGSLRKHRVRGLRGFAFSFLILWSGGGGGSWVIRSIQPSCSGPYASPAHIITMQKSAWPASLRALAVSCAVSCMSLGAVGMNSQLVEDLVAKMTLEEKVGQLELYSRPSGSDFNGQSLGWNTTVNMIRAGQVGASLKKARGALKQ